MSRVYQNISQSQRFVRASLKAPPRAMCEQFVRRECLQKFSWVADFEKLDFFLVRRSESGNPRLVKIPSHFSPLKSHNEFHLSRHQSRISFEQIDVVKNCVNFCSLHRIDLLSVLRTKNCWKNETKETFRAKKISFAEHGYT